MTKEIVLFLMLRSFSPVSALAQSGSQFDVKALASNVEQQYRACQRRETVGAFDRKHHKTVWQKQAWGPPSDVFVDVKSNSESILYPYILTVEFSLSQTSGPERESKADADKDSELSPLSSSLSSLFTARYRTIYLASKDGIRVKGRELLNKGLDGKASGWNERPVWTGACWDQIGVR
jgi:hypothetical protein